MIYNKVIAPFRKYVFDCAYRLCKNKTDAEDITQQVLIKAFIYSQSNFIDQNKIKSFLKTSVRNTFIDTIRRKKFNQDLEYNCSEAKNGFDEPLLETYEDSFSYDSILNSIEINYHIAPVMEKLNKYPVLKETLEYCIQECTYEEIAEKMHTNVGCVKSRLYKARKFVKDNVDREFLAKI